MTGVPTNGAGRAEVGDGPARPAPGALERLRAWFLTGRRLLWTTTLALVLADVALAAAYFRPFLPGGGPLVYGDLGAIYTYDGVQPRWALTLSLYQLTVQAGALVAPWPWSQNAVYVATFVVPSLGIYAFALRVVSFPPYAGVVALCTGSIVNPIFLSDFIMGGEEYGLWLLFTFVGFTFLLLFLFDQRSRWWHPVGAGLGFGLASTQTFGLSGMDIGAVLLTAPSLSGVLLYGLARSWGSPARNSCLRRVGVFLATYAVLLVPLLASEIGQTTSVVGSQPHAAVIAGRAVNNARYTFRPYDFGAALFALPPHPTSSGYLTEFQGAWVAIVVLSLAAAAIYLATGRGPRKWLNGIFLVSYLTFALGLAEVNSGALLPVYNSFPPFDFFDGPDLFVYGQLISVPYMFLSFFVLVEARWPAIADRLHRRVGPTGVGMPEQRPPVVTGLLRARRQREGRAVALACAIVIVASLLATSLPTSASLLAQVDDNPAVAPNSPFASSTLNTVRTWYAGATVEGYILPLPDDPLTVNALIGVVPSSDLWVIPLLSAELVPGYHPSAYAEIMGTLANGSVDAWATQTGLAGVQYIVLQDTRALVTVAPSYLPGAPTPIAYVTLAAELLASPLLHRVFDSGGVEVFANAAFVGTSATWPGATAFAPSAPTSPVGRSEALPPGGFLAWNPYPVRSVTAFPNGSAAITVNGSTSPSYSVLWAPLNFSLEPSSGNGTMHPGAVGFDPSDLSVSYEYTDLLRIPPGVFVQSYVAWYNTSTPASLFGWFKTDDIGYYYSGTRSASNNLTAPPTTVAARVIYTVFANASVSNRTVIAGPPSAIEILSSRNLTGDAPSEFATATALVTDGLCANGTLDLLGPIGPAYPPDLAVAGSASSVESAAAADPNGSTGFHVSLTASSFPVVGLLGHPSRLAVTLAGVRASVAAYPEVNLTIGGIERGLPVPPGHFNVSFILPPADANATGELEVPPGSVLSLLALTLWSPPSIRPTLFSLALPLGSLSGEANATLVTPQLETRPNLGSAPIVSGPDLVPIPGFVAVLVLGAVVLRRRARPRTPWGAAGTGPTRPE